MVVEGLVGLDGTTRWGILSTGKMARAFAADLAHVPGAALVAVGSRSAAPAEAFAAWAAGELGGPAPRAHASYDELVADPDVDVVHVASPHALHRDHTLLALRAGKHVLLEKPATMDLAELEEVLAEARAQDRLVVEAMWTACHPVWLAVLDDLRAGRFGTPRQLHADLGWKVERPPHDRMLDPALGASALLDMGVYALTAAHLLLGPVEELRATADVDELGVDHDVALATRHAGGGVAALTASMTSYSSRAATLATDAGRLELPSPFHHPPHALWWPAGADAPEVVEGRVPLLGVGYGNEAAEVARCLSLGLRESPLVPHALSRALMAAMDEARRQTGVLPAAGRAV